jgi:hypothetical protein
MLAGIGVLIVAGQIHVLFGDKPKAHGLENLAAIPAPWAACPWPASAQVEAALVVGVVTIGSILAWEKFRPALKLVPGALLGVAGRHVLAAGLGLDVQKIVVPESIAAAIAIPSVADFAGWPIRCCCSPPWRWPSSPRPRPCCRPPPSTACTTARAPSTTRSCSPRASATCCAARSAPCR